MVTPWFVSNIGNEFLIRKLKRKKLYSCTLDKKDGKQMGLQLICTPRSRRFKIRCPRKTVCANDIQYRVMQSQHNVVH